MGVVIAEDLALLREGLTRMLQAYQFEVLEAVDNGPSLVRALATHHAAIAARMFVSEKAVSKHSNNIFTKLGLHQSEEDNCRVLAVLAYLQT